MLSHHKKMLQLKNSIENKMVEQLNLSRKLS